MSRKSVAPLAAVLAMAALTMAALAQSPPRGPGSPGSRLGSSEPGGPMLVMAPAVQKELKLTDSQKSQLRKLETAAAQKRRQVFSKNRPADFDPEKMRSLLDSQRREHEQAVAKILDKEQNDRLKELELQREGIMAVARPDIATELELTSAQSEKIKGIIDGMREAERKAMPRPPGAPSGFRRLGVPGGGPPGAEGVAPGGGPPGAEGGPPGGGPPAGEEGFPGVGFPDGGQGGFEAPGDGLPGGPPDWYNDEPRVRFEKMRKEMNKIRSDAAQQVAAVISPDQKLKFDKMLGKPFDFSSIRPGHGGPRNAPRSTRSTRRSRSQTRQRPQRDTEQPEPQMEPQTEPEFPQSL